VGKDMSLIRIASMMVREMGQATADDIAKRVEGSYSAKQVIDALQNAKAKGFVKTAALTKGGCRRRGLAVYVAGELPEARKQSATPLASQVEKVVKEKQVCVLSDVVAEFPGRDRHQIDRALQTLRETGRVEQVRKIFVSNGQLDSTYFVPSGCTVRFNSVFDYAQRA
jgi:predicted transcriptional regulator